MITSLLKIFRWLCVSKIKNCLKSDKSRNKQHYYPNGVGVHKIKGVQSPYHDSQGQSRSSVGNLSSHIPATLLIAYSWLSHNSLCYHDTRTNQHSENNLEFSQRHTDLRCFCCPRVVKKAEAKRDLKTLGLGPGVSVTTDIHSKSSACGCHLELLDWMPPKEEIKDSE